MHSPAPWDFLPHRYPFLVLDRIIAKEPGRSATALMRTTAAGTRGWSSLLLLEAMAQLGGIAAADDTNGGGILAAVDHADFHGTVEAGDTLTVSVTVVKSFGPLHLIAGEVTADGRPAASATITLKVGNL
ncbi:hydroxymyristoyl-ACP dehydratase [Geobacter sulfurreducens]|uniref:(3R)-hydroxyacyl-(Acyl carrier protein) dehydratase n=1 Tax=Geobacter sulfurreducens (strain ATCC 51573 / DSM 12127 / PCA) TaxID=243231 RepID=Q74FZ4_GEOSL|nr:hydroxymyristoyl-ACP dehydratase [Geobacter sulfurreducens]AAR33790.1 (3R)-hydroxyacyl-(acyl carrier protein) dehydratase [Geobacter sulfurreducens PCA]ADI83295.1 (3R)-hydroxyacyl-(acyl carrier protein) dehydratase [Geobacter sulfurreducens KN400]QVW35717.1 hydroxymyristoyl-ACP dehydratase [Geobacter sulfurreducens]UAC04537.1 hydroxymyristoyl-ACP dehydratase [Geobacter sulfurreducens]HCD96006.1 hydroxymyristoyl-ACP dehydratase [Geobacter sulfurreducens]